MKLEEYSAKWSISLMQIALDAGISTQSLYALINKGRDMRLSLAAKIVKRTDGEVRYEDLAQYVDAQRQAKDDKKKK